ncbi:MAG: GTPase Era, partial [Alphaproteobacteria bacterium]|nr:GTPase Era [Alphaproteobacteria bacterium]
MTKKHGTLAIVGAPNAGKSTLTNSLLGQKISIVSPKVQTTRNSIRAIVIDGDVQMIVIDTPGIFIPREDKILERIIVKSAWQALREADHICFVVDAAIGMNRENTRILEDLKKENLPLTVVVNKIDLLKKSALLETFAKLSQLGITDIIPISAKTSDGVEQLKKFLSEKCTHPDWIYDEDQITDAPMRFISSEITREKLFLKLNQELPYSLTVKTDKYDVLDNGQIKIQQTIFVTKESQKSIVLGKRGSMIKQVGEEARKDLTQIVGNKVHLFLFVKVKEGWMN